MGCFNQRVRPPDVINSMGRGGLRKGPRKRADAAVISGVYHSSELRGCVSSPRPARVGLNLGFHVRLVPSFAVSSRAFFACPSFYFASFPFHSFHSLERGDVFLLHPYHEYIPYENNVGVT